MILPGLAGFIYEVLKYLWRYLRNEFVWMGPGDLGIGGNMYGARGRANLGIYRLKNWEDWIIDLLIGKPR